MSTALSTLERALHPATAAIAALAGAVAGGTIFVSLSGAVLGLVVAVGLLGIAAVVLSLLGWLSGDTPAPRQTVAAGPATTIASTALSAATSGAEAAVPAESGEALVETTESEAELLSSGRFADYHVAKAKRMMAAGNFKEAVYQAGASLAHDDLPEARELRETARAAMS